MTGPHDEKDEAEESSTRYGETVTVAEVRQTYHQARDDAESDDSGGKASGKGSGDRHQDNTDWKGR